MNIFSLLTVLFIGLKLTGNIDWAWFWVVSPITVPIIYLIFWVVAVFNSR